MQAYLQEFTDTVGTKSFLNAENNYPALHGVQTNLFKFFLPLAFRIANKDGVSSFIHPEGVYDDPNGGKLRAAMYPRLRLHAQFINELKLFDIDHHVFFSLNVYGATRGHVAFNNVSRLYHPSTLAECFSKNDDKAPLPLERNEQGTWNLVGHPDRIVPVDDETLKLFAWTMDPRTAPQRSSPSMRRTIRVLGS